MHLRAQIERILGRGPRKVKVGKLFCGFIREVVSDCDNFATSGLGVCQIVGNHQNRQMICPRAGENERPELLAKGDIQAPKRFVKQQCSGFR